jgi:hypothetical protein
MNNIVRQAPLEHTGSAMVVSETATLIQAISEAARDPNVDVGKMERLYAMRKEMVAEQAKADFSAALSRVQAGMGRVVANKRNQQTNSDYADYASLDRELRPLYTAEQFALSFGTEDSPNKDEVRVVCDVSHSAGHTRRYMIPMPADGKGAKGGDVMTKTHATGSAIQYGMRYLLKMIFNVAIGKDDDGNGAGRTQKPSMSEQKQAHWLEVAEKLDDIVEYTKQREKLVKEYGGERKVPREVKVAFARAHEACRPKDEA